MTASAMSQATVLPAGYAEWIADVKLRIRAAQQRAALAVNQEMLRLYWQIGRDILDRQAAAGWGTGILSRIETDLRVEFPEMRGFSQTNLKYMRMFAEAWPDLSAMGQRFVDPLPWGQNITLLTKLKTREERLRYAARAVEHGWSRPLLTHHIELRTLEREGKAVTNFEHRLPKPQSDLARETLKDPYRFDFLSLGSEAEEREIEAALVTYITKFLLELGAGFAFVGRQVHLSARLPPPGHSWCPCRFASSSRVRSACPLRLRRITPSSTIDKAVARSTAACRWVPSSRRAAMPVALLERLKVVWASPTASRLFAAPRITSPKKTRASSAMIIKIKKATASLTGEVTPLMTWSGMWIPANGMAVSAAAV